ncbi:phosphoenolpyruvate--protein phosphotransferase [Ornithinimicrobium tianjinense]|uniref:Phosphocarrier protein HPr n=1 Tax=Ornithinimicrobium tianjinense TaxID=1195761 RepID=A0A917BPK5_9MICO|nr:phosphoenolpyruvate--protein phosphotransferase [Ornithinimicrobium tianjinense]GGF49411.1 multiphosphoryl transfer protein (MTP) [Ornithinimicrobium tianjinense]
MISLVVVSHSHALAEAAVTLAMEMAPPDGAPHVGIAAGLDERTIGTDAAAVAEAISAADEASGGEGVVVLLDLGSAVLSAEMALELVDPEVVGRVVLSPAPLVEGLVAAVVAAAAGLDAAAVAREAESGLGAKRTHLGGEEVRTEALPGQLTADEPWPHAVELPVVAEHGLHARPAARLVARVADVAPGTEVRVRNLTVGRGPVDALSLSGVATLDAQQGHVLLAEARGPLAEDALEGLVRLAEEGFGDLPGGTGDQLAVASAPVALVDEPGVAGSGLEAAVGPVVRTAAELDLPDIPVEDTGTEHRRWMEAVHSAVARLGELAATTRGRLGAGAAEVFEAHAALLRDPALTAAVERRLGTGLGALRAWQQVVEEAAARFEGLADPYQRERAQDVRSVGDRVLRILAGLEDPDDLGEGILVVDELDPALAISLDARAVRGVITLRGGATGHGVLVAAARGVPVLTGAERLQGVATGTVVAFDARSGRLEVDPPAEVLAEFERLLERRGEARRRAMVAAHDPAVTTDGVAVPVRANVTSVGTARLAAEAGAEGCGLVRTEALFGQHRQAPTVAEQARAFASIAEALAPHPVTLRTWDVGGDKPLPFIPSREEANPFLGVRGIRAFRTDRTLLVDQLEAACRAAQEHRLQVMFPMVTTREDVELGLEALDEAVRRTGTPRPAGLRVGIMVEVPAAALRVGDLARGLDFVSIGSNDLSQYVLAAERGSAAVGPWADPLEPAVLQMVRDVCQALDGSLSVSVCGSMAADPDVAGLLVGLGAAELSASPASVAAVKERLRAGSLADYRALADAALGCGSAREVRALLEARAVSALPAGGTAR